MAAAAAARKAAAGCGLLLALLAAALRCAGGAADSPEPLVTIGFHEGTKRSVECKNGVLKGLEARFVTDSWSFAEPFIGSIRLQCSGGELTLQYTGDLKDDYVFGRAGLNLTKTVSCNGDLGIAGLKWRRAKIKNPDGAEARLGGLTVLCNRAGNAPEELVLDPAGTAQTHDRLFSCKKVAKYAGMDMPKITKALLWYNLKSWASLEPIECG